MRIALILLFGIAALSARTQSISRLHKKAILVDTHNDVLSSLVLDGVDISKRQTVGHSDLVRWKEGGLDVQFFSVWTGEEARNKEGFFKDAQQEIDSLDVFVLRNPTKVSLALNYRDVMKGVKQNKLVALIGVEGGHMIEGDLAKLEQLAKEGMRYMTLTWNNSNSWATSARDETLKADSLKHKGLTDFGKEIVRKMNELGVIVDLSHTGEQTFYDALAVTTKPVFLSHSSVWSICPVFRNLKDDQIKAVTKNGGVICVNFYSGFISKAFADYSASLENGGRKRITDSFKAIIPDSALTRIAVKKYLDSTFESLRPSIAQLVDHIDYIAKMAGVDHVGIGSDFDGVESLPKGIDDVTAYPKITAELKRRGYSKKDIKKILGGNALRVMKANFL